MYLYSCLFLVFLLWVFIYLFVLYLFSVLCLVCTVCRSRLFALFVAVLIIVSISVYGFYSFRVLDRSSHTVSIYTVTTSTHTTTASATTGTTATTISTSTVSFVADSDSDGIPDYLEERYGLDPSKPNPNAAYLMKHGLTNYLHIVKPLDSDGVMQENEEILDDLIINNTKILPVKTLQNYLLNITSDGVVTNDELSRADNFAFLISKAFDSLALHHFLEEITRSFALVHLHTPQEVKENTYFIFKEKGVIDRISTINPSEFSRIHEEVYKFLKEQGIVSHIIPWHDSNIVYKNAINKTISSTDYSAQLALRLGFDAEKAREATAKAIAYYAVAVKDLNLPEEIDALRILTRGSQIEEYGDHLTDFDPIIIKDVTNRTIAIQSKNIPRDVWMLARFLGYRPEIISEPRKFEWINRMIQQVAWDIFDSPYGPNSEWIEPTSAKRHYPENLTPTSERVWQVILGFHDYMDSLPSKLEKDGIGVIFPFHDSDELQKYIADKTNRTIALFYLAALPSMTLDKMNFKAKWDEAWNMYHQGLIDKNTLGKLLNDALKESIVIGIDAMKKFIEQLPSEYEEIVSKLESQQWKNFALAWYAHWLADRGNHGLANTVSQFIGTDYHTAGETMDEFKQIIEDTNINGITQFLKKVWKYWDLVKFIYGYESGKSQDWGGEWEMYRFGLPIAFRAFGIPHGARPYGLGEGLEIPPNRDLIYAGAPPVEWSVSLPDSVVDSLKQNFSNSNIVIGYGNYFGLFSCRDGLERDGATGIYQAIRDKDVYLWKK